MRLVLLRHGQSLWNAKNLFTGWIDVDLSEKGEIEAKIAGKILKQNGIYPQICFTSYLKRAIHTAQLALREMEWEHIDVLRSWRLNERHYGKWQGKNKLEVEKEYGKELFFAVRRGYEVPPPPLEPEDPDFDRLYPLEKKYEKIGYMPKSESLKETKERVLYYFYEKIVPAMFSLNTVLVAAHGNSLRALIMHIENIDPTEISKIEIPTGTPILYRFDRNMKAIHKTILQKD